VGGATDKGSRDENEDAFRLYSSELPDARADRGWLFAVADGIGGHRGGAAAARLVTDQLWLFFQYPTDRFDGSRTLLSLIQSANRAVWNAAQKQPGHFRMGCTLTALYLEPRLHRALVAHIGDSRCYRYHPQAGLRRLTVDHTVPGHSNMLSNHVGLADAVEVDHAAYHLYPGDRWLLCTDGVGGFLDDAALERTLLLGLSAQATAEALVRDAVAVGHDNATAVVVDVLPA
jgi:serine/threonine protein phosphatase PrpC